MAFLKINGVEIPVKEGGINQKINNIGSAKRSYVGSLLTTRRARKRYWTARTSILASQQADGIEAIASGTGDSYGCDWSTTDTTDRYSSKGFKNSLSTHGVVFPGIADDGVEVVNVARESLTDDSGVSESFTGSGSFASQAGTANVYTAAIADCSSTTGFTTTGTITTASTGVIGSTSNKLTVSNADTVHFSGSIPAATDFSFSGYIYCSEALSIAVDSTNESGTATTGADRALTAVSLTANKWNRFELVGTSPAGGSQVKITITFSGAAGSVDAYLDNLKLEESTYPTAWSTGAASADSNRAGGIKFDAGLLNEPRFTIGGRLRIPSGGLGTSPQFLELRSETGSGDRLALEVYLDGAEDITAKLWRKRPADSSATAVTTLTLNPTWDGKWTFFCVAIKGDISTGSEKTITLYNVMTDGTATSTSATVDWPWSLNDIGGQSLTSTLLIGGVETGAGAGNKMGFTRIDDLFIVKAALTSSQAEGIAGSTAGWGATPAVKLSGEMLPENITAIGTVNAIQYQSAKASEASAFEGDAKILDLGFEQE